MAAPVPPYVSEWNRLFSQEVIDLNALRSSCFYGQLQSSRFRSVVWRILLGCLPPSQKSWRETVTNSRKLYTDLRKMVLLNPRAHNSKTKPVQVNPLSLHDDNPWQQYFADNELRQCIDQDVTRSFPELEYFQKAHTRKIMAQVLFVFARHNPHVEYKQGMHEVLGPLMFVLFYDHQAYGHSLEQSSTAMAGMSETTMDMIRLLQDEKYLEHDAYTMFAQIMRIIEPWYCVQSSEEERACFTNGHRNNRASSLAQFDDAALRDRLYARPQDETRASEVVAKLNRIGDELLREHDGKLYVHLENMQIAPQIYGIRWLRLLFGREFSIQDLLLIWDAIFADGPPFELVDYICVAMLVSIRDLLLSADYTGCLNYLMRYPPIADLSALMKLALHMKNPARFTPPSPTQTAKMANYTHITQAGRPHPNMNRDDLMPRRASDAGGGAQRDRAGSKSSPAPTPKPLDLPISSTSSTNGSPTMTVKMFDKLQANMKEVGAKGDALMDSTLKKVDVAGQQMTATVERNLRRTQAQNEELTRLRRSERVLSERCGYLEEVLNDTAVQLDRVCDSRAKSISTSHAADSAYMTQQCRRLAISLRNIIHRPESHTTLTTAPTAIATTSTTTAASTATVMSASPNPLFVRKESMLSPIDEGVLARLNTHNELKEIAKV